MRERGGIPAGCRSPADRRPVAGAVHRARWSDFQKGHGWCWWSRWPAVRGMGPSEGWWRKWG
ncbi:hypothetical protein ERO13_A05G380975v2 [Gossypium hirsutum]|nr:hypothetical protein ERO13_A05G380975v2 [Gossypium hirsutum]